MKSANGLSLFLQDSFYIGVQLQIVMSAKNHHANTPTQQDSDMPKNWWSNLCISHSLSYIKMPSSKVDHLHRLFTLFWWSHNTRTSNMVELAKKCHIVMLPVPAHSKLLFLHWKFSYSISNFLLLFMLLLSSMHLDPGPHLPRAYSCLFQCLQMLGCKRLLQCNSVPSQSNVVMNSFLVCLWFMHWSFTFLEVLLFCFNLSLICLPSHLLLGKVFLHPLDLVKALFLHFIKFLIHWSCIFKSYFFPHLTFHQLNLLGSIVPHPFQ